MSEQVGVLYAAEEDGGFLGEERALPQLGRSLGSRLTDLVDEETKGILEACLAVAEATLARERRRLDALAAALLERESLDAADIYRVAGLTPLETPAAPAAPAAARTSAAVRASSSTASR